MGVKGLFLSQINCWWSVDRLVQMRVSLASVRERSNEVELVRRVEVLADTSTVLADRLDR